MKIAIVYNRDSRDVINLFGTPNRERIGLATIKRVSDALKGGGHQVTAIEGDKNLVEKLEEFMPRTVKGERPGMVFNVSYGIQGKARYTHVPGILEMVGIPYVGSGPLAHSLALDKVVSKMIFRQHGLPTPDFAVLTEAGFPAPELEYPLIIKPRAEAVSFGLKVVNDEAELREAAQVIFDTYHADVLVERFIQGREINIGLLGNHPPEALPPAEILFGTGGPQIYTYEDKTGKSGRQVNVACPADISPELTERAQDVARRAFQALGCHDCSRVDMRLDDAGNLYILEVNSLPSLGEHGSYIHGAVQVGLDYPALMNRLVEVASARYFGTPKPPEMGEARTGEPKDRIFEYLTERRDALERTLQEWCRRSMRTMDTIGIRDGAKVLGTRLAELRMKPRAELTEAPHVWAWESRAGLDDGTLLVAHLDAPLDATVPIEAFRREPEWLFGEGIGLMAGPLSMLEHALRALRSVRILRKRKIGVLVYADEGRDATDSAELVRTACARAKRVLVLRPGGTGDRIVTTRRGLRKYRFSAESKPRRLGRATSRDRDILRWSFAKLEACAQLTNRKERITVGITDVRSEALPMLLSHRVTATVLVNAATETVADRLEREIRAVFGKDGPSWSLDLVADRPPMAERRTNAPLARTLSRIAAEWEIPLGTESSALPSVAGLVARPTRVVCGMGPVATDLYTAREAVERISLVQRTLLLAQFLASVEE